MSSGREGKRLDSVYRVWLKSFSLMLVLFFILFIAFAANIIFTRLDRNIESLLARTLTITWGTYGQFFARTTGSLKALASELESGVIADYHSLPTVLNGIDGADLWFVIDPNGQILLSNANNSAPLLAEFSAVAQPAWQADKPFTSSEMASLNQLRELSPALAQQATPEPGEAVDEAYSALFKLVAVPFRNQAHRMAGAIVVAHLLNNDNSGAQQVAELIPDSFSTISANGIRISGNISTSANPTFVGKLQTPELLAAINQGERYYGRVKLDNDLDHLVVSDPIRNAQGKVIGALTVGHPSQGLASLKQDTVIYIALSALLCWGLVLAGSALASKRWALPIIQLSRLAKRIYETETITSEHLTLVGSLPEAKTREIEDLRLFFRRMVMSLYEKNREILGYLQELKVERNQLQDLTTQLQEANTTLEARVEEKTLELRNAMMDVVAASNLKSKLLANTSHELRTPLNSIIGFSDMLTSGIYGELTEPQRQRIEIIADSARYLLKLINDLLDVSRIDQGRMVIDKQEVTLEELVESVLAIIKSNCEQSGISIRMEQASKLPRIWVDPMRIKQVLYNVLSNAVKFTPTGGEIVVALDAQPREVLVSVKDTGIGISTDDQLYVFDEFYQGENIGERKQAGFGLGLPLSKKLVELHGGHIELKTALGEGTEVTVHLPIGPSGN